MQYKYQPIGKYDLKLPYWESKIFENNSAANNSPDLSLDKSKLKSGDQLLTQKDKDKILYDMRCKYNYILFI